MAPDGICLKVAPAQVVHSQRRQEKLVKEPVPLLLQLVSGDYTEAKRKKSLIHEKGRGSLCANCNSCEGLDLHFWRKVCKSCGCSLDQHQLLQNNPIENVVVNNSLRHTDNFVDVDELDEEENRAHPYVQEFTPFNISSRFDSLCLYMVQNGEKISIKSHGRRCNSYEEQQRQQILLRQIPPQDFNAGYCHELSEYERLEHACYMKLVQEEGIGKGILYRSNSKIEEICCCCQKAISTDYVKIIRKPDLTWHDSCFQCTICKERLFDEIYFYKDEKLFCGRHYGEEHKKRCAACDELIFSEEFTMAENRGWHVKHFCCFQCEIQLNDKMYVYDDSQQPYCIKCYSDKLNVRCCACEQIIQLDEERIEFDENTWHVNEHCFRCCVCAKALLELGFNVESGHVYCLKSCSKKAKEDRILAWNK